MDFEPTFRIFCQLSEDYSLSIRNGKVVLARANLLDPFQHWIKKEAEGGGFTLFNKGTAQAIKRSRDVTPANNKIIELELIKIPFNSDAGPEPDAVWTVQKEGQNFFFTVSSKSWDGPQGFRLQTHSRMIYDGVIVYLANVNPSDSQNWKFLPYNEYGVVCPKTIRIYSFEGPNYSLTIRDGTVVYAKCDRADPYQHWRKETVHCHHLKNELGAPTFSIVNVATGNAMQHEIKREPGYPISLIPFNPKRWDESLLWTDGADEISGFKKVQIRYNDYVCLDALYVVDVHPGLQEGMLVGLWKNGTGSSRYWKMEEFF